MRLGVFAWKFSKVDMGFQQAFRICQMVGFCVVLDLKSLAI